MSPGDWYGGTFSRFLLLLLLQVLTRLGKDFTSLAFIHISHLGTQIKCISKIVSVITPLCFIKGLKVTLS